VVGKKKKNIPGLINGDDFIPWDRIHQKISFSKQIPWFEGELIGPLGHHHPSTHPPWSWTL